MTEQKTVDPLAGIDPSYEMYFQTKAPPGPNNYWIRGYKTVTMKSKSKDDFGNDKEDYLQLFVIVENDAGEKYEMMMAKNAKDEKKTTHKLLSQLAQRTGQTIDQIFQMGHFKKVLLWTVGKRITLHGDDRGYFDVADIILKEASQAPAPAPAPAAAPTPAPVSQQVNPDDIPF